MLDEDKILERANELYAAKKLRKKPEDIYFVAPECRPKIASDQVKCLLAAIVEALNGRVQF